MVLPQNPLQSETPKSLVRTIKTAGVYLLTCYFLLYSFGTMIFDYLGGFDILYDMAINFYYQLAIVHLLALLGIWSARQDVKKYKLKKGKIRTSIKILIVAFIYVAVLTDAVYYLIDSFEIGVQGFGTEKMKESMKILSLKAEIASIVTLFPYPIFFYGNDMWNWIRKREKLIDEYELKICSKQPITVLSFH